MGCFSPIFARGEEVINHQTSKCAVLVRQSNVRDIHARYRGDEHGEDQNEYRTHRKAAGQAVLVCCPMSRVQGFEQQNISSPGAGQAIKR